MRAEACLRAPVMLAVAVLALALAACTLAPDSAWHGANLLAESHAPFDSTAARDALQDLRATGADTVVLVSFLRQEGPDSATPVADGPAALEALGAAVDHARSLGLRVILKPQVLPARGWAGEVCAPGDWFGRYQAHLAKLAALAEEKGAWGLVVGTELRCLSRRPEWDAVIATVRRHYRGRLSYAAHGIEGMRAFAWWHRLDAIGVSYYPSLGRDPDPAALAVRTRRAVDALVAAADRIAPRQPLWVLEVGMPSASGRLHRPWAWQDLGNPGVRPAAGLQAEVVSAWLTALERPRVAGVALWRWSTDPEAGGPEDRRYVLQNKPAQARIRCAWAGHCPEPES